MANGGIENLDRLMRRFDRMPARVQAALAPQIITEAQGMAEQMIRVAPRDADPQNGEQIRDHIHVEEGRAGPLTANVISDAKDAKGRAKASRVEFGHTAADGTKVPASPSFYPVIRTRRKGIKRRLASTARKALKAGL